MILVMGGIIIARLFSLQILDKKYTLMASEQGKFRKVVYPNRGILFDRDGKAILRNTVMYDLMVIPSKIRGMHLDTSDLCRILQIDSAEFHKRIVNSIVKNRSYRPSVFEHSLSDEQIARFTDRLSQ